MGYGVRTLSVGATLSEHAGTRECEHAALWWELARTLVLIAHDKRYADILAGIDHDLDSDPVTWTVEDWRAGRPCEYPGHNHQAEKAPQPRAWVLEMVRP